MYIHLFFPDKEPINDTPARIKNVFYLFISYCSHLRSLLLLSRYHLFYRYINGNLFIIVNIFYIAQYRSYCLNFLSHLFSSFFFFYFF